MPDRGMEEREKRKVNGMAFWEVTEREIVVDVPRVDFRIRWFLMPFTMRTHGVQAGVP